jgi:hypothetical protein
MTVDSIRLNIRLGASVPVSAPSRVIDSLTSLEVRNTDNGRDGFQMTFSLGRDSLADYDLLRSGILDPPSRVIIGVVIGVRAEVLVDGIITNHQVSPGTKPGEGNLVVTGEDISIKLDLDERKESYANQSDSDIVQTILRRYTGDGLLPEVTATKVRPQKNQRVPMQLGTDLSYIQALAQQNGFVFYVEPTPAPGVTKAHWGLQNFESPTQPALTINMGPSTNVESMSFTFDALGPATPKISILDPTTRLTITIPAPNTGSRPPLSLRRAESLRTTLPTDTANLDSSQASTRASAAVTSSADAVTGSGQLDAVRYGGVLRARQLVGVRGAGNSYDGSYYVKQVTHKIKRGEYKQTFSLSREGRGALKPVVLP